MKKLPNILTISRIILTLGFIYFLIHPSLTGVILATFFFLIASLTDYYDGYYAKKHNAVSNFGKIMDPVADKFLILAAFFIFMRLGLVRPWMFWGIFLREATVTGFRLLAMGRRKFLAAERAGKYKTTVQMAAIFVVLIYLMIATSHPGTLDAEVARQWQDGIYILMLLTVSLTLVSGVLYLGNNRRALRKQQP